LGRDESDSGGIRENGRWASRLTKTHRELVQSYKAGYQPRGRWKCPMK
jgi:hypothetical protein